jgi:hypothetical protein
MELDANGNPINPADGSGGDDARPPDDLTQVNDEGNQQDEIKFSKKQMEQLATLVGRISKKQITEEVLPLIQQNVPQQAVGKESSDVLKSFNEQLQQKIFEGDVLGAIQMANDVQSRTQATLGETQKKQTVAELTKFSDKPFYKEIYGEMKKIAEEVALQGYPPQAAAEYAYFKAKADFLEQKMTGGEGGVNLGFTEGGRQAPKQERLNPLPPQFKAALERDINDGIVKDEAEYRKSLHPSIRKQYGI